MRNGTFYLNNIGSKWVCFKDGMKIQIWALVNGELIKRTPLHFGSFGNFAYALICYKGRQIKILNFADSPELLSMDSHNNEIRTHEGYKRGV